MQEWLLSMRADPLAAKGPSDVALIGVLAEDARVVGRDEPATDAVVPRVVDLYADFWSAITMIAVRDPTLIPRDPWPPTLASVLFAMDAINSGEPDDGAHTRRRRDGHHVYVDDVRHWRPGTDPSVLMYAALDMVECVFIRRRLADHVWPSAAVDLLGRRSQDRADRSCHVREEATYSLTLVERSNDAGDCIVGLDSGACAIHFRMSAQGSDLSSALTKSA